MATKKTKPVSDNPERVMNKLGRPTKYRPEFCKIVIELGRLGKSKAQIAADPRIDVTRMTLDIWCDEYPAFLYALTRARDLALAEWENKAESGIASVGFNSGLWGRIMSARFPDDYREVKETQLTGKGGKDLEIAPTIIIGGAGEYGEPEHMGESATSIN
jgi:hypothetical protein